jgi:nucleolin
MQAVLKNGETLEGRDLFIDLAKERGAAGPNAGTPRTGSGKTAFIKGFDRNDDEDNIRSSLTEFFSECGDINTVRIPTDRESGQIKGWVILSYSQMSWSGRSFLLADVWSSHLSSGPHLTWTYSRALPTLSHYNTWLL